MITPEALQAFIKSIPPKPDVLQRTMILVNAGDLIKAAKVAQEDPALSSYLRNFVNNPMYFFKSEITDLNQVFGILGTIKAKELLYHYMMHLFSPKKWSLFALNENTFHNLQATLSTEWKNYLESEKINNEALQTVISLLPASIIATELIFSEHKDQVALLRQTKNLDYNTILERLVGVDLFDLAQMIGTSWEMDEKALKVLKNASGLNTLDDSELSNCSRYMHMLLFYVLSQPDYIKAGLNDFLDFQPEFVEPISEAFQSSMGVS